MAETEEPPKRTRAVLQMVEPGDKAATPSPQDAPVIEDPPEPGAAPAERASRPWLSFWARVFIGAGGFLIALLFATALDQLVADASAIAPWLGWAVIGVLALFGLAALIVIIREIAAIGRVRRVERVRALAALTQKTKALEDAEDALDALVGLYAGRRDLGASARAVAAEAREVFDAEERLRLFERKTLGPLDAEAKAAVQEASRRVAVATTLMPSALLDGVAALVFNVRMIRRLAQIYGGRAGFLGSLSLVRRVIEHAMAAGLIALGDDLLEPLMGGGVASKVSRRLGEGVVNGAMTARIGLAAMDVCRPLPFDALARPKLREIAWRAISG